MANEPTQQPETTPKPDQVPSTKDKALNIGTKPKPEQEPSTKVKGPNAGTKPKHDPLPPFPEFATLHAMIKPRSGEAAWSDVPWETNLHEARKKAAAQGKPLFIWSAAADPLGCT